MSHDDAMPNTRQAVASTGLLVAAIRAAESERDDPLFTDPYAAELAGPAGRRLLADYEAATGQGPAIIEVRTRFWDEQLQRAAQRGARQFVILAAGRDARAYRLAWPQDTVLFEVDQPGVLVAKDAVLADHRPGCTRRTVGADLTEDWPAALRAAGHDAAAPTVWLVEGLLQYLDQASVDALFPNVDALSPSGSTLLCDIVSLTLLESPFLAPVRDYMSALGAPWVYGTDSPAEPLQRLGWTVQVTDAAQPGYAWNRWPQPPAPLDVPGVPRGYFVTAAKA
jgi:methyltransferase (TIGR00027 family)